MKKRAMAFFKGYNPVFNFRAASVSGKIDF